MLCPKLLFVLLLLLSPVVCAWESVSENVVPEEEQDWVDKTTTYETDWYQTLFWTGVFIFIIALFLFRAFCKNEKNRKADIVIIRKRRKSPRKKG